MEPVKSQRIRPDVVQELFEYDPETGILKRACHYGRGIKGVTWRNRTKPYQAKIRVDGVRLHLGSFATEEEAAKAYQEACIKYHGEFACPK